MAARVASQGQHGLATHGPGKLPEKGQVQKWLANPPAPYTALKNALFKLSAYKMGVSMRLFKLQFLSLFKLPFSISGEILLLNEHLRANLGLNEQLSSQKKNEKPELK